MGNVSDWLTHIDNEEDKPYLRSALLNVNMRLFRANEGYQNLVLDACKHISTHCLEKLDGYKLPHGSSGANVGIPWNIIGIVKDRGQEFARCEVMINPEIVWRSDEKSSAESNCGSIRLSEPIRVLRNNRISVIWFDLDGKSHKRTFYRDTGAFTIQHEVDHNLGILITDPDRQIK